MLCLQAAVIQQGVPPARPRPLTGSSLTAGHPSASRSQRACQIALQHAGSTAQRPAAARRPAANGSRLAALPERLQQLAAEWLAQDAQPSSRQEIEQLVAVEDASGLEERLGKRLQFGAPVGTLRWELKTCICARRLQSQLLDMPLNSLSEQQCSMQEQRGCAAGWVQVGGAWGQPACGCCPPHVIP